MTRSQPRQFGRSISTPIIWASVAVALTIALLVGWTMLIVNYVPLSGNTWLLVLGIAGFVFIVSVLVAFSVFLVRETLETRRQYRFIDSVTHELKSPLASLKLCLETMSRDDLSDEQRESLRGMMRDDVDRLTVFIDDILQASRLAHGRASGVPVRRVELDEVVGRCTETVERRYELPSGTIDIDIEGDVELITETTSLETILTNLLDNAVKYSDRETLSVQVEVSQRRESVVIEVVDHGIGIPETSLKHVFRRFYRAETESVRKRRGTGLGLFVVAALVKYLGGSIEARSDGDGCGTTMRLVLPVDGSDSEAGRIGDRFNRWRERLEKN